MIYKPNNVPRVPLPGGTMLGGKYKIIKVLSDSGNYSLAYLCKTKDNIWTVVKELYPIMTDSPIKRKGNKIVFDGKKNSVDLNNIDQYFESEKKNQSYLCDAGENNSNYLYTYEDISSDVLKDPLFRGSMSYYLKYETAKGKTLSEIIDEKEKLTLEDSLVYLLLVSDAVRWFHKDKQTVHMDLKPDNIYLEGNGNIHFEVNDIINLGVNIVNKICKILDCGGAIRINKFDLIPDDDIYITNSSSYASPEVQLAAEMLYQFNENSYYIYFQKIGFHSDIYSLTLVFLNMILGKNDFAGFCSDLKNRFDLESRDNLIKAIVAKITEDDTYVSFALLNFIRKGLYYSNDSGKDILKKERYSDIDEFIQEIKKIILGIQLNDLTPETLAYKSLDIFNTKYLPKYTFDNTIVTKIEKIDH